MRQADHGGHVAGDVHPHVAPAPTSAGIGLRIRGYVVDMVIFASVAMSVGALAGGLLLATTHGGKTDPSDRQFYTFFAIIGIGTPALWSLLNLSLLAWRGQTGGQYMAGSRMQRDNGSPLTLRAVVAWWCCFNPLLFSWPMACITALPLALVSQLLFGTVVAVGFGVLAMACAVAPVIALLSALVDSRHRTLHDRLVGTIAALAG
jgi:uncharacterized RDD family membrane protein YckC